MGSTPDSSTSVRAPRGRIGHAFYQRDDVVRISRELLGQYIFTRLPLRPGGRGKRVLAGGVIVETEAYAGPTDRASHAFGNRRTSRTEIMFSPGGVAYVYLCYGIHSLFNIITNVDSIPHAILIRAIEPTEGLSFMQKRRNMENMQRRLTAGPGALTEALGISTRHSALDLTGDRIWLNHGRAVSGAEILASPRVGIGYAGPDANRPWRFRLRGSDWTSPAK